MTGAQWEILRPFVDDATMALVRARLLGGLKFFADKTLLPMYTREQVKLVLLVVRIANPAEYFNESEVGVMESVARTGGQQKLAPDKAQTKPRKTHLRPRGKSGGKQGS